MKPLLSHCGIALRHGRFGVRILPDLGQPSPCDDLVDIEKSVRRGTLPLRKSAEVALIGIEIFVLHVLPLMKRSEDHVKVRDVVRSQSRGSSQTWIA